MIDIDQCKADNAYTLEHIAEILSELELGRTRKIVDLYTVHERVVDKYGSDDPMVQAVRSSVFNGMRIDDAIVALVDALMDDRKRLLKLALHYLERQPAPSILHGDGSLNRQAIDLLMKARP